MRRFVCFAFAVTVLAFAGSVLALDLTTINRTIAKLPELRSKSPGYCLLVFGPDTIKRVWLVHDDDVLYVDRNGNGDLTEPDERIRADAKDRKSTRQGFWFHVGDIPDEPRSHKDLQVSWSSMDHLRELPQVAEYLDHHPNAQCCRVAVDIAIEGCQGMGLDGRVQQLASDLDERGVLEFASRPEDAPIIHFGGPWEIALTQQEKWRVAGTHEVDLIVGTPGFGPGTTASVAYERIFPPGLVPNLRVQFPPTAEGQAPIEKSYELKLRCCTFNFYGDIRVPDDVGQGTATVDISLDSLPAAYVSPTSHHVKILPAIPGRRLEPVSARLYSKLPHERPNEATCNIHYSPDGQRLVAGDYPGGIVHVWEIASGKRLMTLEMGEGLRSTVNYFFVTPDFKTAVSATQAKGAIEKIERDGKTLHRVAYRDAIYVWDLESGDLLRTLRHDPARGYLSLAPSPDRSVFFTLEEVPGEFASHRPRALSLWDLATGGHRQVHPGNAIAEAFSADGSLVAIVFPKADDQHSDSVKVFATRDMQELCSIPLSNEFCSANVHAFTADRRNLVATVTDFPAADKWWDDCQATLKMWELSTGREVFSWPAPQRNQQISAQLAPDGRTILVSVYGQQAGRQSLMLLDAESHSLCTVKLNDDARLGVSAFHPSKKWLAVANYPQLSEPKAMKSRVEERPQPRVDCIDLSTGNVVESMVLPQSMLWSLAFSPDGTTLATSGKGAVLLWDFREPPGHRPDATDR